MANKSASDQIKKFSGVSENVKKTQSSSQNTQRKQQEPEEPRISVDQVVKAFQSFGLEPNERGQNDVGYWTTRPVSEGPKLMEELYKRRNDLNQEEDSVKVSKKTLPRLSDEDINALFDEYGLPAPDPEWARSYLPNDPAKIRSILEMQRKTADDLMKNESKNAVEKTKYSQQMPPQMPSGQGGPLPQPGGQLPMGMQQGMMEDTVKANPFFIGDNAIVRITNINNPNTSTVWLVDVDKKLLRPFLSEKAFKNAFENPDEAEKSVTTISSKELGPGGVLEGFTPVKGKQGIKEDGSMDKIDFSPSQIQSHYGKEEDPDAESKAMSILDGVVGKFNQQ